MVISQRYSKFTSYDITSKIGGKKRKITLQKPLVNSEGKHYINIDKQVNSFIPNFIHSLDASNIVLLFKKMEGLKHEVITVHDCFGVHANDAEFLSYMVKQTFISIYGDKDCIDKFHSYILYNIKAVYRVDRNVVEGKNGITYNIPDKPVLGNMNLEKQLIESKYFIN